MDQKHQLIKDLLPLYIDDMVSVETKQLIKKHLQTCKECKEQITSLKEGAMLDYPPLESPLSNDTTFTMPNENPTFIVRLKRLGLLLIAAVIVVMGIFSISSWILGQEAAEEEQLEKDQELIQLDNDLISLSPPKEAIFQKSGVQFKFLKKSFGEEESTLTYKYFWNNPNIDYVQEDIYWPNHLIAMDLTNNEVIKRQENSSSVGHSENVETWVLDGVRKDTEIIGVELPNLAVFFKPKELQVPLQDQGETLINKEVEINGIRFFIEKAELTSDRIKIHYQQLDSITDVGLYELSFNIIDQNAKHWSKEPNIDFQTDEHRITDIPFYQDMKKPFALHLEHAVLIVPGLHYKFSIK
ncbi:zf-HC2 domain-containing protein [Ammoniphilus resinae]|uniref:Putative zinc-finger domain-containing protein n=1 Tax=Ammoniphilus resinae TaxID=861532 RepID=A0ABS4GIU4_9BACL|nr:zf-HC2 domain-containing protein [Ammoniphilus resinae]MBP1930164.1 hypothetical protein [Ammoniphilus resinae]